MKSIKKIKHENKNPKRTFIKETKTKIKSQNLEDEKLKFTYIKEKVK